jgi:hypothetical protein
MISISIETNLHREAVRTFTDLQRTNQRDKTWQEKKIAKEQRGAGKGNTVENVATWWLTVLNPKRLRRLEFMPRNFD